MRPTVSVLMSTFNNEATIVEAVNSILEQTHKDFELLVVNDGSTDKTGDILHGMADPRLKIINNERNIGLTRSLNKAITFSKGSYLARQDADDISLPQRLARQYEFMEEHRDIALLGTSRATLDAHGKIIATTKLPRNPDLQQLLRRNCLVHGSIMLRRDVLNDVGYYNEDFRLSQDYEFWLRIAKNHKIMNLQEPLYGVRRHGNRVTLSKRPQAELYRLLAVNLARDKVTAEVMEHIRKEGIETYYDYLDRDDRFKFHKTAGMKYARNKCYSDAVQHLEKLAQLAPRSLGIRLRLVYFKMKGWWSRQ